MLAGLPAATITVRRFLAKVWGACAKPSRTASSIFASSAEANTSAGAPCSSCVSRVELPAKFSAPTGAGSPSQQRLKDASCYRCAGPESVRKWTKFLAEVLSVALASRRIFVDSSPEDAYRRDD